MHPGGDPDDVEGRGGRAQDLRPARQLLRHQAGRPRQIHSRGEVDRCVLAVGGHAAVGPALNMRLLSFILLAVLAVPACGEEIRVLSGGAARAFVEPLAATFPGHTVKLEFQPMGKLVQSLAAGYRADMVNRKAALGQGGYITEPVGRGEIELGIHQISEILPVKGVRLAGPLPPELQKYTVYVAAPVLNSQN